MTSREPGSLPHDGAPRVRQIVHDILGLDVLKRPGLKNDLSEWHSTADLVMLNDFGLDKASVVWNLVFDRWTDETLAGYQMHVWAIPVDDPEVSVDCEPITEAPVVEDRWTGRGGHLLFWAQRVYHRDSPVYLEARVMSGGTWAVSVHGLEMVGLSDGDGTRALAGRRLVQEGNPRGRKRGTTAIPDSEFLKLCQAAYVELATDEKVTRPKPEDVAGKLNVHPNTLKSQLKRLGLSWPPGVS